MAQRTIKPTFIQVASCHFPRRLAAPASIPSTLGLLGALSPAFVVLLALPAAAAGLDAAKVNADPIASRTLEAIDAAHHLQSLGTLAHYVLTADAQGQICSLGDRGNDIFMLECAPTPQHPKSSLLTGENGRLLVVSMYGANGHPLPTGDAFERLPAIAPAQPEAVASPVEAAAEEPSLGAPVREATSSDRCLWTSVHNQKVYMGSLRRLDVFVHQIGGESYMDEMKDGHPAITCRFPDSRTHRTHELVLEGDGDAAACYGITHTALDGQTLPYAQYKCIFIDHK